eukprot:6396855-Pyramimonas_sp.AAC.1
MVGVGHSRRRDRGGQPGGLPSVRPPAWGGLPRPLPWQHVRVRRCRCGRRGDAPVLPRGAGAGGHPR